MTDLDVSQCFYCTVLDLVRPAGFGDVCATPEELEARQAQPADMGATSTPIREMPFGRHLDLRDPDGIAPEFTVPNDTLLSAYAELREPGLTQERLDTRVREVLAAAGLGTG